MFETLSETTVSWMFYLSAGLGIAMVIMVMLFLAGNFKKWTVWHGVGVGVAGAFVALALHNYIGLFDWIMLGLMFSDVGATMFLVGFVAVIVVMISNLIATNGKTLFR